MASVALTGVVQGSGAVMYQGIAGATIAQGNVVYLDSSDNRIKPARANAANTSTVLGVALNAGTAGAPITVQKEGVVQGLTGLTAGSILVLADDVAGSVMPTGDLTTGDRISIFGVTISTTAIRMGLLNSGVVSA